MLKLPPLIDFEQMFYDDVWSTLAEHVLREQTIEFKALRRAEQGENIVFFVDDRLIVKIYTPKKNGFHRERAALQFVEGKLYFPIPRIVAEGEVEGYYYLIITQVRGTAITRADWLRMDQPDQIEIITQLATGLKDLHTANAANFDFDWREFLEIQVESAIEKQRGHGSNPEWAEKMPAYFDKYLSLIPSRTADAFMHGDIHFGNLRLIHTKAGWQISGLFDFADSLKGFHEYEFVAIGVLMIQGQRDLQREFFRAYGYGDNEIDETLRHRMMMLTMLYEYSSLRRYAERLGVDPMKFTLDELERAIWSFV